MGKSSYEKYGINEESWTKFVQTREDPSWQVCYFHHNLIKS